MKKVLLASTALVGASLLAAPAYAGNATTGDNYSVKISGAYWFQFNTLDEDVSAGHGRGYKLNTPEGEVYIDARAKADNGITYGVSLELNASTDDATAADEAYAQLSSDSWGTVQMGDNDGAENQMKIGSFQSNKSGVGTLGGLTALSSAFHNQFPGFLVRTDWDAAVLGGGDSAKIIYFSPRFAGFQLGASLMPDSGVQGLSATERDDDGDFENVVDLGANYVGKFGDVGVSVGASYVFGEAEGNTSLAAGTTPSLEREELEVWTVGVSVNFAGFVIGADYRDNNESGISQANKALGADAGHWWSVGVGYGVGPWGVDAHYALGEADNRSTLADTEVTRYGVGASYAVAPGWRVTADVEVIDHENPINALGTANTANNKAKSFLLTNFFSF